MATSTLKSKVTAMVRSMRACLFGMLAGASMVAPTTAFGWDYSFVPLFWDTGIDPNVALMIDDSGSMQALVTNESFQRALAGGTLSSTDWFFCNGTYDVATRKCNTKNTTSIRGFAVFAWSPPGVQSPTFNVGRNWTTGTTSPSSCSSSSSGFFKSSSGTTESTTYVASGICLNNHGMENGALVEYVSPSPEGSTSLSTTQQYYVVNRESHGFQLATSFGGSPITFDVLTGSTSGNFTFRRYRPSSTLPNYIGTLSTGGSTPTVALCNASRQPTEAGYYVGTTGSQPYLSSKTLPASNQVGVLVSNSSSSGAGTRDSCVRWKMATTGKSTNTAINEGRDYNAYTSGTLYFTPDASISNDRRNSATSLYARHLLNSLVTSADVYNFDDDADFPFSDSDPDNFDASVDNRVIPNVTRMQAAREAAQEIVVDFFDKMNIGLFSLNTSGKLVQAVPDGSNPDAAKSALIGSTESMLFADLPASALDGAVGGLDAGGGTPLGTTQAAINSYFRRTDSTAPIDYRCQKNYAVVMTDGEPSANTGDLSAEAQSGYDTDARTSGTDNDGVTFGDSGNDPLAAGKWVHQNIVPYTIGFGIENNLLKRTPLVNRVTVTKTGINTAAETIKLAEHGLEDGDYVEIVSGAASGLANGYHYYVVKVDADNFKLAGRYRSGSGSTAIYGDSSTDTANNRRTVDLCKAGTVATTANSGGCINLIGTGSGDTMVISTGPGKSFFSFTPQQLSRDLGEVFNRINNLTASASAVSTNTKQFGGDTLVYQARFNTEDWSGEVAAYPIVISDGVASVDTSEGAPTAWTTRSSLNGPSDRTSDIYTWNPTLGDGVGFDYSNLTAAQQAAIGGATTGPRLVSWLKGNNVSGFRDHSPKGLLGDILNSDPVFLAGLNFGYNGLPASDTAACNIAPDANSMSGSGCTGAEIYTNYVSQSKTRDPMLYVGANDGMLHGLDAKTGDERLAFIPAAVYQDWNDANNDGLNNDGAANVENKLLSLALPSYDHRYFVDGSLSVGDAFLSSTWGTYLVGALGRGGRSVFAIDVTHSSFTPSAIMWEFTHQELGYTYGKPIIARLADNKWYAIFPNGLDSMADRASVFLVNLANPNDYRILRATVAEGGTVGTPESANRNGMMVVQVRLNNSRTVTDIYAGDMRGNIWKFDVYDEEDSLVQFPPTGTKLFTARSDGGEIQSITGGLRIGRQPDGLGSIIFFGTGKYFETKDNVFTGSSVPQVDSFYAVLDNGTDTNLTRGNLVAQQFQMQGEFRTSSTNAVNYTSKRGWYIDLLEGTTKMGERVVSTPVLYGGRIIFVSIIPMAGGSCEGEGRSWLNELDALSGNMIDKPVLDTNNDGKVDSTDKKISSIELEGLGSEPTISEGTNVDYKIIGTTSKQKSVQVIAESPAPGMGLPGGKGRMSWRQLQ